MRIETSIASSQPITLIVAYVITKRDKAWNILALNSVKVTKELHRLKQKILEKSERRSKNSIVMKYGPITAGEGRLRAAADDNLRLQKK